MSDAFMGLVSISFNVHCCIAKLSYKILVPLVEKVAEHLTAVDEAHDNQVIIFNDTKISRLIHIDELCPCSRAWSHHTNRVIQCFLGCYCWMGPG